MKFKKITITSETAHFGQGLDDSKIYDVPPPSTVYEIINFIFRNKIKEFCFGYTFESDGIFVNSVVIPRENSKHRIIKKQNKYIHDIKSIQLHYDCKLTIYTDIDKDIDLKYILCFSQGGYLENLYIDVEEVDLIKKEGASGYQQFTTMDIGNGKIYYCNMGSKYNIILNTYVDQIMNLRCNNEFKYDYFFDMKEGQSIFMWKYKHGKVDKYIVNTNPF